MSKVFEEVAFKVAAEYGDISGNKKAALDPAFWGMLLELIPVIIEAIQKCMTPKDVPEAAKNPTRFQKLVVRLNVRRELGRKDFRQNGDEVVEALFAAAAKSTRDEVQELYDAV